MVAAVSQYPRGNTRRSIGAGYALESIIRQQAQIRTPEAELLFAVVGQACRDSLFVDRRFRIPALVFIQKKSCVFDMCCRHLGLEPDWVRRQVDKAAASLKPHMRAAA